MKLLDWMHRKFRQGSGDPYQDFNINGYPRNCRSARSSVEVSQNNHLGYHKQSRMSFQQSRVDGFDFMEHEGIVEDPDEEAPLPMGELFHGLLAVGTLGSLDEVEDPINDKATPTFGSPALPLLSVEAITEKEECYETTEDDLMVINAELEKVLLAPEAEKSDRISSARASQVSAKQLVISGCPLQEYLLGSLVVEAADTMTMIGEMGPREKKENHRTSLGELFMRSRMADEGMKKDERDKRTAGMQLIVKKMLRRRGAGGSSKTTATFNDAINGDVHESLGQMVNSDNKFNKIIQMFHKKVHPETIVEAKKVVKENKCRSGKSNNEINLAKATRANRLMRKERGLSTKNGFISAAASDAREGCGDSSGNREHWIKTDAEYLVLEL